LQINPLSRIRSVRESAGTHYISGTERMTIMFDALLAAIPDGAYFNQTDFGTKLKDQLLVSDMPFSPKFLRKSPLKT
jgi:predicted metal-dependent hydrolase